MPAKVVEIEGDRVHGGLDEGDQAGGEQFAGQQVSHGEGDTKVQDGEADGLFMVVSPLAMKAVSPRITSNENHSHLSAK